MAGPPSRNECAVPSELLTELGEFIAAHMGLHFPESRRRNLEKGICSAAREFGFDDPRSCIAWIISSPLSREQTEILASHLTVGETYFWRESRGLELLGERIIPELMRGRRGDERRLRIWSAGCSTGEEPYSIAMLINGMDMALREWNVSILATDINPHALRKAEEGTYSEWSFRNTPQWLKERYFRRTGDGRYEISPRIRGMVNFGYLNLVEDVYPSLLNDTNAMDVIFCRNVLMYFAPELAKKVTERFSLALVDGGWLIVSPSETSPVISQRFRAVHYPDAVLYRKQGPGTGERAPATWEEPARGEIMPPVLIPSPPKPKPQPSVPPVLPRSPVPSPQSPYDEASALYGKGLYAEAAEKLSTHLEKKGDDTRALALLCRIRANQGKLSEALELSEKALATDKLNAGLHYLHAEILQEQGTTDEAAAALKRALYLDQEMVLAHFALANLAMRQGKDKEARRYFMNASSLLEKLPPDAPLPGADGITAGRLLEVIRSTMGMG